VGTQEEESVCGFKKFRPRESGNSPAHGRADYPFSKCK